MKKILFLTMCCCFSAIISQARTISEVRLQQQNTQVHTSGIVTAIYGKNQAQEEEPVGNPTYDFEKDGCYYNILSLTDLTVELTCRGDENDEENNLIATYSGDFRVPETVEYSNRTFTVIQIHSHAFINCSLGTLTIPATVRKIAGDFDGLGLYGVCQNLVIEDSEEPLSVPTSSVIDQVYNSVYMGRHFNDHSTPIVYDDITDENNISTGGAYHSITFGNNVTKIGMVCKNCQNLTSVTLSSSVKELYRTFIDCANLTSVSGDGVEELEDVFTNSGIQTINMPNLKVINGAFRNCNSLQAISLPEGIVSLGKSGQTSGGAFSNSTSLTSVTIPATVLSIAKYSFAGCTSLNTISVANNTPILIPESTFDMSTYQNATLKVPMGTRTTYMYAPIWQNFLNIVEDPSLESTQAAIVVSESYDDHERGSLEISISDPKTPFDAKLLGYDHYTYDGYDYYTYTYDGYIVPVWTNITITATPHSHHKLDSLVINGTNVTAQMQGNVYIYHVTNSAIFTIRAYFSYDATPQPEPELVYVRIKQATGGQIEFPMYQENNFSFYIVPEEGWQIHSVTSNGEDISSLVMYNGLLELYVEEDKNIVVTFVESPTTDVPAAAPSNVRVYGANDRIFVNGAAETNICIFNEAGIQILSQKTNQDGNSFIVDKGHVYLVQVGNLTFKVAL